MKHLTKQETVEALKELFDYENNKESKNVLVVENKEEGHKVWYSYVPKCVENMTWEDEPIEVEISLRPQNRWKPSEEQMKQLEWIAKQNKDNILGKELMSLYQDLKNLRKE